MVPAMAVAYPTLWRTPIKVLYDVAAPLLATAAAGLVLVATPTVGPTVAGRPVLGVGLGMVLYAGVSVAAFAGLLAGLQDRRTANDLGQLLPMHAASTLGTTSVGIVSAALWELQPELVPFVVALAAAVHLAQRSSVRATALLAAERTQHERLTRVVDGASDGITLLDHDGRIQVWNPAMERLTGTTAAQAQGRRVEVAFADRRHDPLAGSGWDLHTARPDQPRREEQTTVTHPDGTARDVVESHALTFDDHGRCTGSVVVVRDISRQRELERLRSDFVARISHELRTPLTPIRGFASVLLRRGDDLEPADRAEILQRLSERADHLHALVEDLLLVTRMDGPQTAPATRAAATDLADPVATAVADLRAAAPDRIVTFSHPDDLPAARADGARTTKIVGMLLDNAHRYTPSELPIEVELDADGDHVRVHVIDHGPGIPAAHRELVFERFSRLEDPLTMRTGGVGVGLFLARQLAEAMDGAVDLEVPGDGRGCLFTLTLPRAEAAPSSPDPDASVTGGTFHRALGARA